MLPEHDGHDNCAHLESNGFVESVRSKWVGGPQVEEAEPQSLMLASRDLASADHAGVVCLCPKNLTVLNYPILTEMVEGHH